MPRKKDNINDALKKLRSEQKAPYMPQHEIPEEERFTDENLAYLNEEFYPRLFDDLGIVVGKPGEKAPETDGVPRLFIMDEKDPAPKTLEEAGVETGSRQFWELAQQGKLFGYSAGSREAVQIQAGRLTGQPRTFISAPLTTSHENFKLSRQHPLSKDLPEPVARPGFFARLMNRINSNWYKKENEDYRKYQAERARIEKENREAHEAYEKELSDGKTKCEQLGKRMNEAANKAYGPNRTEAALGREKEAFWAVKPEKNKAAEDAHLVDQAATAKSRAEYLDGGIKTIQHIYGTRPRPLAQYAGNQYKVESFSRLKPVELPVGLKVGDTVVGNRLFTNLALHALQDKSIVGERYLEEKRKLGVADPEGTMRAEGMTQEEVDKHIARKGFGLVASDSFNSALRATFDTVYFGDIQAGRESAEKAIRAYQTGDRAPLSKIIATAAETVSAETKNETAATQTCYNDARLTCELLDLLDEDEELKAEAEKQGLTKQMVKDCRGMDLMRDLLQKCLDAEKDLAQAAAEHREMDPKEKKDCLHDIFKYRTAEAHLKEEVDVNNNPEMKKAADVVFSHMAPSPGREPLPPHTAAEIVSDHLSAKMLKSPSVLKELRKNEKEATLATVEDREPEPDNLDKLADMTVEGMGLDKISTAELAEQLVNDNGPKDKELLREQGKIMQRQQQAREKENAIERQLNDGVVYNNDGPQL